MDRSGAMPRRAWLIICERATGSHLLTVATEIDGGTLRTKVSALREGTAVNLIRRLEWADGTVSEEEPEPMTLPEGGWIQIVEMG